ncbi:MAG TPA: sigma-70 family RNA polymerase sigma factor [Bacteroidota bacterium]|jgi:RNA polymerase sigma-70 factor (ECF subfamily)
MAPPPSDWDIVQEVRSGDARSFRRLVKMHESQAMTLAVRVLKSREEAEEIVQDAFVRAFRNLHQFRGEAKFGTWLHRIVYNLCMTKVSRRRNDCLHQSLDEPGIDLPMADESGSSGLEQLQDRELRQYLTKAVDELPEKLRTVVTLFYVHEMKYNEICTVMDLPEGTVKTYLFRGRAMLRKKFSSSLMKEVTAA